MVNLVAASDEDLHRVEDFLHAVRVVPHTAVPIADGASLSARIWLLEGADRHPLQVQES